jgi:hypothetical protein
MIIYTCSISATTDLKKTYEKLPDIIIKSPYPIPANRLRVEVLKLADKKYISFGHLRYVEEII